MITNLLDSIRDVIGTPEFQLPDGAWNYGAILEYTICGVVLCIVISSVFKCIRKVFG